MSRSNNSEIKNPSQKFFTWKGSSGTLTFYDKEAKTNIDVPIPFQFLVLDKLITISGFSDEDGSGIWSNEIRNTRNEQLTVRTKHGIKKTGLYDEVKTVTGAKFASSVYIAYKDESGELSIGNLRLSGCAVSAWIEFSKGKDVFKGAIGIAGKEEGKKGATKYFSPVFNQVEEIAPETNIKAMELDGILQEYLKSYFAMRGQIEKESPEDYIEQRNAELNQFEPEKAEAAAANSPGETNKQNVSNYPSLGDDDVPF